MAAAASAAAAPPLKRPRLEDAGPEPGWEWLEITCCLGREKSSELSAEDRAALQELRDRHCNEPFDAKSEETDRLLCELWNAAFPEERIEKADNSKRWRRLGFQADDPRTDVRAGRFALDQLLYFARTYPERLQQVARQAAELDYPLAISCFNLSHLVVVYFDLCNSEAVSPVKGAQCAGRVQLRNFARLCSRCPHGAGAVVNELLSVLLGRLHETWKQLRVEQNCNLMDFPKALQRVFEAHEAFWRQARNELADLQQLLLEASTIKA